MKKCRACGKEYEPSDIASLIGMQFGFEITMILLGGYAAVCFYSFQSIFALVASMLVGGVIFYVLLPKKTEVCDACFNDSHPQQPET